MQIVAWFYALEVRRISRVRESSQHIYAARYAGNWGANSLCARAARKRMGAVPDLFVGVDEDEAEVLKLAARANG